MGLPVAGDPATSADNVAQDETEEAGNEDESIVHHTASVGDVEVCHYLLFFLVFLDEVHRVTGIYNLSML